MPRSAAVRAAGATRRRAAEAGSDADAEARRSDRGLCAAGARSSRRSATSDRRSTMPALLSVPVTDGSRRRHQRRRERQDAREHWRRTQRARRLPRVAPARHRIDAARAVDGRCERGDILRIVGAPDDVERAAKHIGFVEHDLAKTDLTFLAGGICAGMLLGLLKLRSAASSSASARPVRFWWSASSPAGRGAATRCSARFRSRRSGC